MTPAIVEMDLQVAATGQHVDTDSSILMKFVGQAATDPKFDADKMGKMLEMVRELKKDEAAAAFSNALANIQNNLPRISKDGRVKYKDVNFTFATYENIDKSIRPLLAANGFSLLFDSEPTEKGSVMYIGTLAHKLGHSKTARMVLPADTSGGKNAIQAIGSTETYARRYLVTMLLNIVTEGQDDDGNGTSKIDEAQCNRIRDMFIACEMDERSKAKFLDIAGVATVEEVTKPQYPMLIKLLNEKQALKRSKS